MTARTRVCALVFTLLMVLPIGCATSPKQKVADNQRKAAADQRKVDSEQKHWQQVFAPYSDAQLRFKLAGLNQTIARRTEGLNILLAAGNGIGALIAQGQIDGKVKELDAVGLELSRRQGIASAPPPDGTSAGNQPQSTEDAPFASGSGFFITDDGWLVTNAHVVEGGRTVRITTGSGLLSAKVIQRDAANDLALLKVDGTFDALPVTTSRTVKLGQTVATVGFPLPGLQGFAPKLAKGEVASLTGSQDNPRRFQISVPIQPGNSGGPLVDAKGNVVGVIVASLNPKMALEKSGALPENVNYAVKSSLLLSLLESVPEIGAKLKEANTGERSFEDTVAAVQKATALVLVYR